MRFFKSCRIVKRTRAREMLFRVDEGIGIDRVHGPGTPVSTTSRPPAEETPREL